MANNTEMRELLEALKEIKHAPDKIFGICNNIYIKTGKTELKELFKEWVKKNFISDDPRLSWVYPVTLPKDWYWTAMGAFNNLPLWEGEYGNNRREFLDWCIESIAKELGEENEKSK